MQHFTLAALGLFAQAPNPGHGTAPPGSEHLLVILRWLTYCGFAACVAGVVLAGAMMGVQHRHGTAGENGARLGWTLAGALIIGAASALVDGVM